jgi:F-type H+-transporting ATPase subunit a
VAKRGCLGCSFPILIIIGIFFLAIFIIGFLAGPIGQGFLNKFGVTLDFPAWLEVPRPDPHLAAPTVLHIFGLPVTNTILAGWFTVVVMVLFSFFVTRRMKVVPGRVQAIFEFLLGWMYDLCQSVAGEKNGRRFFPVVTTIFLFVFFNAWFSLIPGFGSIEIGHHELLRGANTDVNTTLAIALVSFVFVIYYGLKMAGVGFVRQYVNFGPFFRSIGQIFKGKFNVMDIFSGAIGIFVGGLEFLSLLIRNVSFTFRLFGNMTAGEILILIVAFLLPLASVSWMVYGLELLVGFVQALIFAGLTLVFVTMAVTSHEAESH